jgi:hypothetical protein
MEDESMKKMITTYGRTKPNLVDISTLFVRIATFVAVTVGGILGYYFIDRHFVEESKANKILAVLNTNLAALDLIIREQKNRLALEESQANIVESKANALLIDINRKIAEIDKEVKEFSKHLEMIQKETQVSILTTEFLNNLAPSIEVNSFPEKTSVKERILSLVYSLGNKGKYSFVAEKPEIILATDEMEEGKSVKGELQLGQDYYFPRSPSRPGHLPPSRTMPYQVDIVFQHDIPKILYCKIIFTARTPDSISKVAARYTKGLLTEDELAAQCKFTSSITTLLKF